MSNTFHDVDVSKVQAKSAKDNRSRSRVTSSSTTVIAGIKESSVQSKGDSSLVAKEKDASPKFPESSLGKNC